MSAIDRIVFFGTPEFAVPTLAALVAAGRAPVRVVTQPVRPAGRGRQPLDPPVARWARERNLQVSQPERVRDPAFLEDLAALALDVAVVVAFGQIFPRALLDLPRLGCLNLHASLLPRWRGASPIQAALAAGDKRTGVSTMLMEAGLDTGPVLLQEATEIGPEETAEQLSRRLAETGGRLMVRTLQELERGDLTPRPQALEGATYAPRLSRDSGRVDWSLSACEIRHRLRAYTPWPGLTAELRGAPVKLLAADVLAGSEAAGAPGTYLGLRSGRLAVACGGSVPGSVLGSVLGIVELQRPGKRALSAADFANGARLRAGERFS
jgi:methionyl-tRNA formyltransferase